MHKVQYKFRIGSKYRQITERMIIPTDPLGFILFSTLADVIQRRLVDKGLPGAMLIWYRIAD